MAIPAAAYIVFGAVIVVGTIVVLASLSANKPLASSYDKRGPGNRSRKTEPPSPPPSPPIRRRGRRRRSPERRSNSPARVAAPANGQCGESRTMPSNSPVHVSPASNEQHVTCRNCGVSPFIIIKPCNHPLCRGCLENNDTCPDCHRRIESCSPPIPPFGKCRSCNRFTKLFQFLDCNHSLSLCIRCFELENTSYKVCPECKQKIRGSDPKYPTSGVCHVCGEFTRYGMFQPCGHGNFCRRHALQYLENSDRECSECGRLVAEVV